MNHFNYFLVCKESQKITLKICLIWYMYIPALTPKWAIFIGCAYSFDTENIITCLISALIMNFVKDITFNRRQLRLYPDLLGCNWWFCFYKMWPHICTVLGMLPKADNSKLFLENCTSLLMWFHWETFIMNFVQPQLIWELYLLDSWS